MTRYGGGSSKRVRSLMGAVLTLLVGALAFMTVSAAPAGASTNHAVTLGLSNTRVDIQAGDSVTFDAIGGLYRVTASVDTGSPVRYANAGTYAVSWTVQKVTSVLGPLGSTVTKLISVASCTATVVVAPVAARVSSVASTVKSAVKKIVPKVHVGVSLPQVHASVSAPAPHSTTTPAAGAPAVAGASSASGRTGGPTTTANRAANAGGAASIGAGVAAAGPTTGSAVGAGGGFVNNVPAGNSYAPVSMDQPDTATAGQQQPKGDSRAASAFGSARLPVLLAIFAILALLGVTVGYARVYVFGRMI
jgi:hypothetical protein